MALLTQQSFGGLGALSIQPSFDENTGASYFAVYDDASGFVSDAAGNPIQFPSQSAAQAYIYSTEAGGRHWGIFFDPPSGQWIDAATYQPAFVVNGFPIPVGGGTGTDSITGSYGNGPDGSIMIFRDSSGQFWYVGDARSGLGGPHAMSMTPQIAANIVARVATAQQWNDMQTAAQNAAFQSEMIRVFTTVIGAVAAQVLMPYISSWISQIGAPSTLGVDGADNLVTATIDYTAPTSVDAFTTVASDVLPATDVATEDALIAASQQAAADAAAAGASEAAIQAAAQAASDAAVQAAQQAAVDAAAQAAADQAAQAAAQAQAEAEAQAQAAAQAQAEAEAQAQAEAARQAAIQQAEDNAANLAQQSSADLSTASVTGNTGDIANTISNAQNAIDTLNATAPSGADISQSLADLQNVVDQGNALMQSSLDNSMSVARTAADFLKTAATDPYADPNLIQNAVDALNYTADQVATASGIIDTSAANVELSGILTQAATDASDAMTLINTGGTELFNPPTPSEIPARAATPAEVAAANAVKAGAGAAAAAAGAGASWLTPGVVTAGAGILATLARVFGGSTQTGINPATGLPYGVSSALPYGGLINPATGRPYPIDPNTGLPYDPATGLPIGAGLASSGINAQSISKLLPFLLIGGVLMVATKPAAKGKTGKTVKHHARKTS